MNQQEQFLKDTDKDAQQVDILDMPLTTEDGDGQATDTTTTEEGTTEDTTTEEAAEYQPKNRRERRLMKQLEDERRAAAFVAGKLAAREEARTSLTEEADYLKGLERIFGTETPEAQIATDLLKKAVVGARNDAEERALTRLQEMRRDEAKQESEAESELDSFIEDIEDTYHVTLNPTQEKAFFQMLVKMSPKDDKGRVTDYADPHAVWEVFQEKLQKKPDTRAKNLASRGMVQSTTATTHSGGDPMGKYLRENGII